MREIFALLLLLMYTSGFAQNKVIWYDPITVADKTYGNLHPRIALDKNYKPIVLWGDPNGNAYMSKMTPKGFAEPVQINEPGQHVFTESWAGPEMTNHGDTVYVVYKHLPEERSHIFLKHSYDGGATFSIETMVDDSDGFISRFPTVAIDPYGNPLVAYMRLNAGFKDPRYVVVKSKDLGETFTSDAVVNNFSGGLVSDCCPATVVESGNATVIVYRDNLSDVRNVWAGISTNMGNSFRKGLQLDTTNWSTKACPAHPPHGIIISDTLYSVYSSGAGDSMLVYLSKASLHGLAAITYPLTGNFVGLTSQNFPRIANSGNAAAIVWEQSRGVNNEICMLFTNEITNGFPALHDVMKVGSPANADVALADGHVHVVWQDDSSGNIYYRTGSYQQTVANKLLAENTTVYLQPTKSGKYFTVTLPDIVSCMMVDMQGKELEMDMKCKKGSCKVFTEELDPGLYVVKMICKDEKIYTYKYEVKEEVEKEEKEKK